MTGTNFPSDSSQCGTRRAAPMPEHERLLRQRNRRRPDQPERAEVRHRRDRAAGGIHRQFPMARQLDEFVVALNDHVFERFLIGVANDGHQHAVLGFDGEADVNGVGMNNFAADEPSSGRAIFRRAQPPARARRKVPGPGLGLDVLRCASSGSRRRAGPRAPAAASNFAAWHRPRPRAWTRPG